jgi:hypothetical protein
MTGHHAVMPVSGICFIESAEPKCVVHPERWERVTAHKIATTIECDVFDFFLVDCVVIFGGLLV